MRKRVLGLALAFAASASLTGCAGLGDAEWAEPWESAEYGAYGGSPYRERVEMDDDEKEILAGAFVAEDEIRGGRLKEAERYALRQLRAVKDWLSERHPEEDFVVTSMSWQSSELEGASFTFVRRDELGLAAEAVDNARYVHVARVHGDANSPVLAIDEDFHGESETFGAEDPVNDPLPAAPEEEGWDRWFDDADDDVGLMEEAMDAAEEKAIEDVEEAGGGFADPDGWADAVEAECGRLHGIGELKSYERDGDSLSVRFPSGMEKEFRFPGADAGGAVRGAADAGRKGGRAMESRIAALALDDGVAVTEAFGRPSPVAVGVAEVGDDRFRELARATDRKVFAIGAYAIDRDGFGYWDVGAEPARTVRSMEEAFSAPRSVEGRVRAFVGNASGRTARFRSPEDGTEVDLPNGGTAEFRYRVGRMGEPAAYGGTDFVDGV